MGIKKCVKPGIRSQPRRDAKFHISVEIPALLNRDMNCQAALTLSLWERELDSSSLLLREKGWG